MKNRSKRVSLIMWWIFFLLSPCSVVQGETSSDIQWKRLETKYTIIHYQSFQDLKKFSKKVVYSPREWGLKDLLSSSESNKLTDNLGRKVDALYERVQEILGMHKKMNKVNIIIYPDKELFHAAYSKISKKSSRSYGAFSIPKAWYIHEFNTIYINVDDLHEGILAHEMAHSIIDHFLFVRPPEPTAEILARYVDTHLFNWFPSGNGPFSSR